MTGETLAISIGAAAIRAARLDAEDRPWSLGIYPNTDQHALQADDIFAARITARAPEFDGAFLDLGGAQAFLPHAGAAGGEVGETRLVQIASAAHDDKLATVRARLALAGLYAVYFPTLSGIVYAKSIAAAQRPRLAALGRNILDEIGADGGRILWRRAAPAASDAMLSRQIAALTAQWRRMRAAFAEDSRPRQLSPPRSVLMRAMTEHLTGDVRNILIDHPGAAPELAAAIEACAPGAEIPCIADAGALRERIDFSETTRAALAPGVALPKGGALFIERTRACWTIDIDAQSADAARGAARDKTRSTRAVNLAAAREIPRQLALRGVGGQIVVDFINTSTDEFGKVVAALEKAAAVDADHGPLRRLDRACIAHLTRKRRGPDLLDQLTEPAASPILGGRRLTALACALDAIAALEAALDDARAARLRLTIAREIDEIIAAHAGWRETLAARFGGRFEFACNPDFAREDYDVQTL